MKKQTLKLLLTVICVLAAGICYSCSRQTHQGAGQHVSDVLHGAGWTEEDGQVLELSEDISQVIPAELPEEGEVKGEVAVPKPETDTETAAALSEAARYYVHICGAVENPGVYEMEQGDRVFQAVERAGGFAEDAMEGYLNLALEVEDGMKIVVPSETKMPEEQLEASEGGLLPGTEEETPELLQESGTRQMVEYEGQAAGIYRSDGTMVDTGESRSLHGLEAEGNGAPAVPGGKVNLNTATKEELMTLRGIGEAKAEDIIQYRQEHGPFSAIEDIKKISGIKDAAFQKIKDDITV